MFDIPLPIYFFIKEHPLETSNESTNSPLLINQFVSLIPGFNISFPFCKTSTCYCVTEKFRATF